MLFIIFKFIFCLAGVLSGKDGCTHTDTTKADCLSKGNWIDPLQTRYFNIIFRFKMKINNNRESCLSVMGCRESKSKYCSDSIDHVTNKTKEECEACGGSFVNVYNWRGAKYQSVKKFKSKWEVNSWKPVNQFIPVISNTSLQQNIESFIYLQPALSFATSFNFNLFILSILFHIFI